MKSFRATVYNSFQAGILKLAVTVIWFWSIKCYFFQGMQLDFIMNSLDLIETLTSQYSMKTFAQVRIDFRSFPSDSCTNILLLVQSIFHAKSECIAFFSPCRWFSFSGAKKNFHKYRRSTIDSLLTPYDYGSVMHYRSKAFSKNGKPTIIVKKHRVCFAIVV